MLIGITLPLHYHTRQFVIMSFHRLPDDYPVLMRGLKKTHAKWSAWLNGPLIVIEMRIDIWKDI